MPTVYILQPSVRPKDLSSASRYGEIRYLIPDPQFQSSMAMGQARKLIEDGLKDYVPGRDYTLFLGGDPIGAMLLCRILFELWPKKAHAMLRWERERTPEGNRIAGSNGWVGFYVPVMMH